MTHICVMNLQKRLQNKLDWLKATKGIKTADAKLTVEELETIVGLMNVAPPIEAICPACHGSGQISTGCDEWSHTICRTCEGTGEEI